MPKDKYFSISDNDVTDITAALNDAQKILKNLEEDEHVGLGEQLRKVITEWEKKQHSRAYNEHEDVIGEILSDLEGLL